MDQEPQEPDQVRTGMITRIAIGVVVITSALVAIAWWLVKAPPPARYELARPSPLDNALFERAEVGQDSRIAGEQRLQQYRWVDRDAHLVQIPIERAIDAVVAEPSLIGPTARQEATR